MAPRTRSKSNVIETGVAHFTVYADFIVEHSRLCVLSEKPEQGVRFLVESFPEMPGKLIQEILDGTKTLVGNSNIGITVTDQDPEDAAFKRFIQDRSYIYAGRFFADDSWWRPRARVTDRGGTDARWAIREMEATGLPFISVGTEEYGRMQAKRFALLRHQHYAYGDNERAFVAGDEFIIFEKCSAVPSWWPQNSSPAAAVAEWRMADRGVEARGHAERYGEPIRATDDYVDIRAEAERLQRQREKYKQEEAAQKLQEEEEDRRHHEMMLEYQKKILEQAGDNMFELSWEEANKVSRTLQIPRAPFEICALTHTELRHLRPEWQQVCPSGMKMIMDDPFHTDWMVGAGLFDFGAFYENRELMHAVFEAQFVIQQRLGNFECVVLNDAQGPDPIIAGRAMHPEPGKKPPIGGILILPDLHPKWLEHMMNARAIITENGGAGAHLVQVARDKGVTIVRVPGAVAKYPSGKNLEIEARVGVVRLCTY